jgi:hypothetical protein
MLVVVTATAVVWKADFFLLPFATLEENGAKTSGYVYANSYRFNRVSHLLITRRESHRRHSYLASLEDGHGGPFVLDCEDWIAPHVLLFMFPDVNPPCIHWYAAEDVLPEPKAPKRSVKVESRLLEFTANDGKRVSVRW